MENDESSEESFEHERTRVKPISMAFLFTTLVDTDKDVIPFKRRKRRRAIGTSFKSLSNREKVRLSERACDEVRYTQNGIPTRLCIHDIVILKDGEIEPVVKIFSDGRFCVRKRKVLYFLKDIAINLSHVNTYEQGLLDRNRYWYKKTQVQVYSNTYQDWFDGVIEKVFYIESEDKLVAHPEKWFALSYNVDGMIKYKQLPWHSVSLRALDLVNRMQSCEDQSLSSDAIDATPSTITNLSADTASTISLRNSIFE